MEFTKNSKMLYLIIRSVWQEIIEKKMDRKSFLPRNMEKWLTQHNRGMDHAKLQALHDKRRPCQETWPPCRHHGLIMIMLRHDHYHVSPWSWYDLGIVVFLQPMNYVRTNIISRRTEKRAEWRSEIDNSKLSASVFVVLSPLRLAAENRYLFRFDSNYCYLQVQK